MKLPEIQRSQAQAATSISPQQAAAPYASRTNAFAMAAESVHKIVTQYKDDAVNVATGKHRQVGIDTLKFTAENEVLTRKQLGQLGIDDQIVAKNLDGTEMEIVPRHYWAAVLLEKELETSRTIYQDKIPGNSAAWTSVMAESDSKAVLAVAKQSGAQAKQYMAEQLNNSRELAIAQNDWDAAEQIQDTGLFRDTYMTSPGLLELHKLEIAQGRELDGFSSLMLQGKYDEVMDIAADVERDSSLTHDDLLKVYFSAQVQQGKEEDARDKAIEDWKEDNYMRDITLIAKGELSLGEVTSNYKSYTHADLPKLISAARTGSGSGGSQVEATENTFATEIDMASRGVFPDGIENLAEYQKKTRREIQQSMTHWGPGGVLVNGLSPTSNSRLLDAVTALEEVPYTSRQYKGLVKEMQRRIMRSDDTGPAWLAKADTAQMMSNAVDDLHDYMAREVEAGRLPDLRTWERENMPIYMNDSAKAAFIRLPPDLVSLAVYTTEGRFSLDYDATIDKLTDQMEVYLANDPDVDLSTMERKIKQFGEYWEAFGEFAE